MYQEEVPATTILPMYNIYCLQYTLSALPVSRKSGTEHAPGGMESAVTQWKTPAEGGPTDPGSGSFANANVHCGVIAISPRSGGPSLSGPCFRHGSVNVRCEPVISINLQKKKWKNGEYRVALISWVCDAVLIAFLTSVSGGTILRMPDISSCVLDGSDVCLPTVPPSPFSGA